VVPSIDEPVKTDSCLGRSGLRRLAEPVRGDQRPSVRTHVPDHPDEALDVLHINRFLVVLAVDDDQDVVLADPLADGNIYLPDRSGLLPADLVLRRDLRIRCHLTLDLDREILEALPLLPPTLSQGRYASTAASD